jgi:hypothetical protein
MAMPLDASTLRRAGGIVEAAGGEVLAVDVHHGDNGSVIIDLTLDMPDDVAETDLAAIAGESTLILSHRPAPPEKDPSLRLIRRLAAMLDADEPGLLDDLTASVFADVCGTVSAQLLPLPEALAFEVARFATERRASVVQRTRHIPLVFDQELLDEAWLLAVPDPLMAPSCVALVTRPLSQPFVPTEVARLEMVMGLRARLADRWDAVRAPVASGRKGAARGTRHLIVVP